MRLNLRTTYPKATPLSQGKYHGKPLSATEVIRLYDAGERDFRGAILRGNTFHKANLSGADFSGADIRSARFVDATLQNTNPTLAMPKPDCSGGGLSARCFWWL